MKKKVLIGTLSAAIVLGGAIVVGATNLGLTVASPSESNKAKVMISADKAEQLALLKVDGEVESVELERKNGKFYYEVDIEKGTIDYDVYLDAYTGEIYSVEKDQDDDSYNKNTNVSNVVTSTTIKTDDENHDDDSKSSNKSSNVSTTTQKSDDNGDDDKNTTAVKATVTKESNVISREQAIQKAEKAVNGKVYSVENDDDDDKLEYELKLKTDKGKVEVEMNAKSGEIVEIDRDGDDRDDDDNDDDDDDHDDDRDDNNDDDDSDD